MAAGHVIVVVLVALLGGAILNAGALTDAAAQQPFGWKRTVAVVAVTPLRGLAGALGVDRAHRMLAEAAADATSTPLQDGGAPEPDPGTDVVTSPSENQPSEDAEPSPSESPPAPHVPTRRDPLRVWVGGDSLTSEFGPALADRLARTNRAKTEVEYRFSTGLARPDYFDWPARLHSVIREQDPEVFVAMFGANDGQNIAVGGDVLTFGTPQWREEYAQRVDAVMALLAREDRDVFWVGQPIMRAPDFDQKMQLLNDIYRERARVNGDVEYVDSRRLFSRDGAFSPYLNNAEGQPVLMRQQDGVHLTRAGGERLTDVVVDAITERWDLTAAD
jgi:hypothetical protein